uniref:YhhN-like protein n=1 Tax=Panagrolaimus sp. PS1159 TaxID=55785 RepID=A0AC35FJN2_9BILA
MIMLTRTQMIIIYGLTLLLVHASSNGFEKNVPLCYTLPLIVLCVMCLCTQMQLNKKLATIGSFLSLAVGLFYWSLNPQHLTDRSIPFCISDLLYLYTYWNCVKKFWKSLGIVLTVYFVGLIFYCFGDLYRSLPLLVISVAVDLFITCLSIFAAGSLWKNGVQCRKLHNAKVAAFLRFIGLFIELFCGSALMLKLFGKYNYFNQFVIFYYIAQFLRFVSNEQTF